MVSRMGRILIVDDDRNVLRALGRVIHFMPVAATGGEVVVESFEKPSQALERISQLDFDLVIADYLMPSMHGIAFMQKLIELRPGTQRILMSGYADILEAMAAIAGIAPIALLAKPWDVEQLKAAIVQAMQLRANGRQKDPLRRAVPLLRLVTSANASPRNSSNSYAAVDVRAARRAQDV
jgi:DNA-binding NtrC family response regulator